MFEVIEIRKKPDNKNSLSYSVRKVQFEDNTFILELDASTTSKQIQKFLEICRLNSGREGGTELEFEAIAQSTNKLVLSGHLTDALTALADSKLISEDTKQAVIQHDEFQDYLGEHILAKVSELTKLNLFTLPKAQEKIQMNLESISKIATVNNKHNRQNVSFVLKA